MESGGRPRGRGDTAEGQVTVLDHSGAWLQIDDMPACIPLAEIAWFEIEHPSSAMRVGDWVRVRVTGRTAEGVLECSIRKLEGGEPAGREICVDAVIETPKGSHNIYRFDAGRGSFILHRVLHFPLRCPFEIGCLPATRGAGGEPLRLVVLSSHPTFPGCCVECRIVGLLRTLDEAGPDETLLGVAARDSHFDDTRSLLDVSRHTFHEIVQFFRAHRRTQNHRFSVRGWERADAAESLIAEARARFAGIRQN